MEHRRRVPRQSAGWSGTYKIDGGRRQEPHECLVIDISILGVGLELYGPVPEDLVGRRIAVEVEPPVGKSVSVALVGEVRNTAPGVWGGVRVGVEFIGLSATERSILDALELMQVAW